MAFHIRNISICLILFVFGGCYTQIRSPQERLAIDTTPSYDDTPDMVVQRFEYYYNYGRNEICDPYEFSSVRYRDSCIRWPYTRHINWNRHSVAWNYACWMSVYDRTWQGCSPVYITPHVVYRSPVIYQEIVQVPKQEIVIPRVNPRTDGSMSGGAPPPPPHVIREPIRRPSTSSSNSGSSTSQKQATDEKKEKDKEEKREEKRTERKKRGGMR